VTGRRQRRVAPGAPTRLTSNRESQLQMATENDRLTDVSEWMLWLSSGPNAVVGRRDVVTHAHRSCLGRIGRSAVSAFGGPGAASAEVTETSAARSDLAEGSCI
jgi:hypothetical protein